MGLKFCLKWFNLLWYRFLIFSDRKMILIQFTVFTILIDSFILCHKYYDIEQLQIWSLLKAKIYGGREIETPRYLEKSFLFHTRFKITKNSLVLLHLFIIYNIYYASYSSFCSDDEKIAISGEYSWVCSLEGEVDH